MEYDTSADFDAVLSIHPDRPQSCGMCQKDLGYLFEHDKFGILTCTTGYHDLRLQRLPVCNSCYVKKFTENDKNDREIIQSGPAMKVKEEVRINKEALQKIKDITGQITRLQEILKEHNLDQ